MRRGAIPAASVFMIRLSKFALTVSCLAVFAFRVEHPAAAQDAPSATETLLFYPDWFPGVQFAGVYVARDRGFYDQANLAVQIETFSFGKDVPAQLDQNADVAALGTMEGYIFLQKRAAGDDLVALTAVLRESPAGLISLAAAPVEDATDFIGKTIGVHHFAAPIVRWFARKAGVVDDDWHLTFVDNDLDRLARDEVEAMQGYATEELVEARAKFGDDVRFVSFRELGFDAYSQIVFTTRAQYDKHRAVFARFVDATRAGWNAALENRWGAVAAVLARLPTGSDSLVQKGMLDALEAFVAPKGATPLGPLDPFKLEKMQEACVGMGLLERVESPERMLAR